MLRFILCSLLKDEVHIPRSVKSRFGSQELVLQLKLTLKEAWGRMNAVAFLRPHKEETCKVNQFSIKLFGKPAICPAVT